MTHIITIRPGQGGDATVQLGKRDGLTISSFPMSQLRTLNWQGPDPDAVDGLLIASANAVLLGGEELERYLAKPVFAVGETTAALARQAGFTVELTGSGGLKHLLSAMPDRKLHLLRIAARRHIELKMPEGVTTDLRIAYEVGHLPMADDLRAVLQAGDVIVLLHSAGSAEHFSAECNRLVLDRSAIQIAALGERIAAAAGAGWKELRFAPQPRDPALLALAAQMCQN